MGNVKGCLLSAFNDVWRLVELLLRHLELNLPDGHQRFCFIPLLFHDTPHACRIFPEVRVCERDESYACCPDAEE
jgi:hypothetical protein